MRGVHSLVAFMVRDELRHVRDKEFEVSWVFDRICRCWKICSHPDGRSF